MVILKECSLVRTFLLQTTNTPLLSWTTQPLSIPLKTGLWLFYYYGSQIVETFNI